MLVRHFAQCGSQTALPSSPRNQREFNGSRPSIFPEGGYCTVRKRQPVSLTLPDHLFNFAGQELIDLSGIIDLAAAIENSQAICLASMSSCGLASSLNHVDIVVPRSLAEELLGSGLVPKFRRCGKSCSRERHGRQRLSGTKPALRSGPVFHPLGRCAAPILVDFCQR